MASIRAASASPATRSNWSKLSSTSSRFGLQAKGPGTAKLTRHGFNPFALDPAGKTPSPAELGDQLAHGQLHTGEDLHQHPMGPPGPAGFPASSSSPGHANVPTLEGYESNSPKQDYSVGTKSTPKITHLDDSDDSNIGETTREIENASAA